jgi:protein-S-isoprenylcysteine O-methyltransferase Ste14
LTALHLAVLSLCVISFAIFGLAGGLLFKPFGRYPAELRLVLAIGGVSLLAEIGGVALWEAAGARAYIGMAMFLLALALMLWAAWHLRGQRITRTYCQDSPIKLIITGPYRLMRHPCYTSYLLAYAAGAVASGCPWLWLVLAAEVVLYIHAALFEEKKFEKSALAAQYAAYRARTGMFLPDPLKMARQATDR